MQNLCDLQILWTWPTFARMKNSVSFSLRLQKVMFKTDLFGDLKQKISYCIQKCSCLLCCPKTLAFMITVHSTMMGKRQLVGSKLSMLNLDKDEQMQSSATTFFPLFRSIQVRHSQQAPVLSPIMKRALVKTRSNKAPAILSFL